jgi:ribosomal protein S18 acetylase RimI-like enzyme
VNSNDPTPANTNSARAPKVELRAVEAADEDLLFRVYAGTRSHEVAAWGWAPEQAEPFLRMQFRAQQQAYEMSYEGATSEVILLDGNPAGRIVVRRSPQELLGVDIALLPEFRNAGIGSHLIQQLQRDAEQAGVPFVFQVSRTNPSAIRLYERLGFVVIGVSELTLTMEWNPPVKASNQS